MRIALAQIQSGAEPTPNLGLVEEYTRRAADAGARLVLFPEATMCRFGVPLAPIECLRHPLAQRPHALDVGAHREQHAPDIGMHDDRIRGRARARVSR